MYLLVSPYTTEKVQLMHKIETDYARELETEEKIAKFVRKLLLFELMPLNEAEIEQTMLAYDPF